MQVGLGCVRLGGGDGRSVADDVRLVRDAIDLGVTVFDTANVYGGGASERVLGRAVRKRRDEVIIATKAGFVFRSRSAGEQWARRRAKDVLRRLPDRAAAGPARAGGGSGSYAHQDFSSEHIRAQVHASLRRLGTDRIDVFQLHGPEGFVPGVVDQLADLVVSGDIVTIGIGADSVDAAAEWLDVPGVSVLHVPFGVLEPHAADQVMPAARRSGQEVWVRGVLGGGLLNAAESSPIDHPKGEQVEQLNALAADAGMGVHDLALRYAVGHAASFSTAIVGSTSVEHLARNVDLLAGPALDPDLAAAVDRIAADAANGVAS